MGKHDPELAEQRPNQRPTQRREHQKYGVARIPAIVTAHSKFIVTDKLLMLEG